MSWAEKLPLIVELIAVELPGRGRRIAEPPFRRLTPLLEALIPAMVPLMDMKFAFFGHSMGATIAFEFARELRRRNLRQPEQIFVSGTQAPQIPNTNPISYNLPDDEFRAELARLQGTPIEILESAELMKLMMPMLRADFELVETYEYEDEAPLHCPIAVYGGIEDLEVPHERLSEWKHQTDAQFSMKVLPGDHFFLRSAQRELLESLARKLIGITTSSH
jgi:medium-chain acyl-[acyl-carrier-protein] hydrolase